MKPKIIKSKDEYQAALAHIETLMEATPGSPEEEELELFVLLVEQYENEHYPIDPPDPIDAILFRMDQLDLKQKDLVPFLGSKSKVSEVLNRKRPLSLSMMRALHEGLQIPAAVLLQEPGKEFPPERYDARDYPFMEMFKRGYFGKLAGGAKEARARAEELLHVLFAPLQAMSAMQMCCRHADNSIDHNALKAWQARAIALAQAQDISAYNPSAIGEAFFKKVVRASFFEQGPALVPRILGEYGIHFVILEHLPKTYLDGAAFMTPEGRPVVGMTLRHDRLDNFWFTLIHELVHVDRHLGEEPVAFFDDTDGNGAEEDPREEEANRLTRERLIAPETWDAVAQDLLISASEDTVTRLAEQLEISPAIIAGRIRWESKDYSRLTSLIGSGEVRRVISYSETPSVVNDPVFSM